LAPIDSAIASSLDVARIDQAREDNGATVAAAQASAAQASTASAASAGAAVAVAATTSAPTASAASKPLTRDSTLLVCLQRALVCHVSAALAAPVSDAATHSLMLLLEAFSHSVLKRCDEAFATLIAHVESVTPAMVCVALCFHYFPSCI
jgi:hypothetical protein